MLRLQTSLLRTAAAQPRRLLTRGDVTTPENPNGVRIPVHGDRRISYYVLRRNERPGRVGFRQLSWRGFLRRLDLAHGICAVALVHQQTNQVVIRAQIPAPRRPWHGLLLRRPPFRNTVF